jgi:hypothetical protein
MNRSYQFYGALRKPIRFQYLHHYWHIRYLFTVTIHPINDIYLWAVGKDRDFEDINTLNWITVDL